MIQVAIVEDHPVFRQGLTQVIETAPGLELAGVARSVDEFDTLRLSSTTIVLLDLQLPGSLQGPAAVAHLVAQGRSVLVLSASETPADVIQAIGEGARGYLTKQAGEVEILSAIQAVADGRTYVSATLAAYLLQTPIRITKREREILELVAGGDTDQDIAEQLTISVRTVHSTWTASVTRPAPAAAPTSRAWPSSAASSLVPRNMGSSPRLLLVCSMPAASLQCSG
jgi:DNA-binding NarL/FixJ family response regulator